MSGNLSTNLKKNKCTPVAASVTDRKKFSKKKGAKGRELKNCGQYDELEKMSGNLSANLKKQVYTCRGQCDRQEKV